MHATVVLIVAIDKDAKRKRSFVLCGVDVCEHKSQTIVFENIIIVKF